MSSRSFSLHVFLQSSVRVTPCMQYKRVSESSSHTGSYIHVHCKHTNTWNTQTCRHTHTHCSLRCDWKLARVSYWHYRCCCCGWLDSKRDQRGGEREREQERERERERESQEGRESTNTSSRGGEGEERGRRRVEQHRRGKDRKEGRQTINGWRTKIPAQNREKDIKEYRERERERQRKGKAVRGEEGREGGRRSGTETDLCVTLRLQPVTQMANRKRNTWYGYLN